MTLAKDAPRVIKIKVSPVIYKFMESVAAFGKEEEDADTPAEMATDIVEACIEYIAEAVDKAVDKNPSGFPVEVRAAAKIVVATMLIRDADIIRAEEEKAARDAARAEKKAARKAEREAAKKAETPETPEILASLKELKRVGDGEWSAICPAHNDETGSLSIKFVDDHYRLFCFAGCELGKIWEAMGIKDQKTGV